MDAQSSVGGIWARFGFAMMQPSREHSEYQHTYRMRRPIGQYARSFLALWFCQTKSEYVSRMLWLSVAPATTISRGAWCARVSEWLHHSGRMYLANRTALWYPITAHIAASAHTAGACHNDSGASSAECAGATIPTTSSALLLTAIVFNGGNLR